MRIISVVSALMLLMLLLGTAGQAQTFAVLHTFSASPDGFTPYAPVITDNSGNLYGTTYAGGEHGKGIIYKIDPSGTETVLHSFINSEGGYSFAGLLLDGGGNLYGATRAGPSFGGAVFKLRPDGRLIVLHRFAQNGMIDGFSPYAGLILDKSGNLYGTTVDGGAGTAPGTVFEVDHRTGVETILYSFMQQPDGQFPAGTVIRDTQGNIYSTTTLGGLFCYPGCGTIFKIDPSGAETVLYSFTGGADGNSPGAGLTRDSQGNLYGTTIIGGAFNQGTIFKLDPSRTLTVLHDFGSSPSDGSQPVGSGVIRDASGDLYGTTQYGGAFGYGTVYKLAPGGTFTLLHSFSWGSDGAFPWAGVIRDSAGNLYGTTRQGGDPNCDCGVVFKIAAP